MGSVTTSRSARSTRRGRLLGRPAWSAPSSATRWAIRRRSPAPRERNVVQIADPALPRKQRSSDRNQINKNRRNGYAVSIVPGPETTPAQRAGFLAAYEQTMRRTGAAERYFFGAAYFDRILEAERTWLALALAPDGAVAAASIAVRSDGLLHYYLSGSADSHLRDSPMKNVVAALVELAAELGLPLNLGGGIAAGDRAGGVQARLRQPRAGLAHLGARLRRRRLRAPLGRREPPAASSPPIGRRPSAGGPASLSGFARGRAGEGEGFDRLAAVCPRSPCRSRGSRRG